MHLHMQLRLQVLNQPLPVEGNLTATVYSVEPARDNSSQIVITVSTNTTTSPASLTNQLTQPLEQTLAEVMDINQQISFAVLATERRGMFTSLAIQCTLIFLVMLYVLCCNLALSVLYGYSCVANGRMKGLLLPHYGRWLP